VVRRCLTPQLFKCFFSHLPSFNIKLTNYPSYDKVSPAKKKPKWETSYNAR